MSTPLGSVCDFQNGGTPSRAVARYYQGDIPWITGSDIVGPVVDRARSFITDEAIRESATNQVPAGTVLLVTRTSVGKVAVAGRPLCFSQDITALTPDGKRLDTNYLVHFLRTKQSHFERIARGATIKGLTREAVANLQLPLPPLREQRRIAAILDKADALRAKRRAALAKLDTLTQSIFLDMFGDPATNPKGWARIALSKLLEDAEVFVDGDWVESKDQDPNGEVRLIQLADIGDGSYLDRSSRFLSKATAVRLRCTPLKVGDLLVARMPDPLGRACIFPGDKQEAVTVVDVCIIRPKNARPDPVWLMCCLNSAGFRRQIAREATGTTRKRISRGNLSRLKIIAPPHDQQQAFADRVARRESVRDRMAAGMAECDQLFSSLQHRAFRGEL